MSACDTCWMPGRCCSGFVLDGGRFPPSGFTALEATVRLAEYDFPFLPLFKDSHGGWRMWCPNLTLQGRCGDYDHRPTLCHTYQPGSDKLCAMYDVIPNPVDQKMRVPEPHDKDDDCCRAA